MNTENENSQSQISITRLPRVLQFLGVVVLTGSVILSARLIWEQTVWTWERGPQMVGFSLVHGTGAILLIFPPLLFIWTAVVIVLTLRSKLKRKRMEIAPIRWAALALAILVLVLVGLPEGFWQRAFASRMAASSRAGDLLVYAAYRGDFGTVRGLIAHGVPIDATDHAEWRTAAHAAAANGNTQILRYLVSRGANVNALDRSGDSPLELAASRGNKEATEFLVERGAKKIRRDDTQHEKAIHDRVQDDIRELDRAEGRQ